MHVECPTLLRSAFLSARSGGAITVSPLLGNCGAHPHNNVTGRTRGRHETFGHTQTFAASGTQRFSHFVSRAEEQFIANPDEALSAMMHFVCLSASLTHEECRGARTESRSALQSSDGADAPAGTHCLVRRELLKQSLMFTIASRVPHLNSRHAPLRDAINFIMMKRAKCSSRSAFPWARRGEWSEQPFAALTRLRFSPMIALSS